MEVDLSAEEFLQLQKEWNEFVAKVFEITEYDIQKLLECHTDSLGKKTFHKDMISCKKMWNLVRESATVIISSPRFNPRVHSDEMKRCIDHLLRFMESISNTKSPIDLWFSYAIRLSDTMESLAFKAKSFYRKQFIYLIIKCLCF